MKNFTLALPLSNVLEISRFMDNKSEFVQNYKKGFFVDKDASRIYASDGLAALEISIPDMIFSDSFSEDKLCIPVNRDLERKLEVILSQGRRDKKMIAYCLFSYRHACLDLLTLQLERDKPFSEQLEDTKTCIVSGQFRVANFESSVCAYKKSLVFKDFKDFKTRLYSDNCFGFDINLLNRFKLGKRNSYPIQLFDVEGSSMAGVKVIGRKDVRGIIAPYKIKDTSN